VISQHITMTMALVTSFYVTYCSDFTAHHYDNGTCDKLLYNILMLPT